MRINAITPGYFYSRLTNNPPQPVNHYQSVTFGVREPDENVFFQKKYAQAAIAMTGFYQKLGREPGPYTIAEVDAFLTVYREEGPYGGRRLFVPFTPEEEDLFKQGLIDIGGWIEESP